MNKIPSFLLEVQLKPLLLIMIPLIMISPPIVAKSHRYILKTNMTIQNLHTVGGFGLQSIKQNEFFTVVRGEEENVKNLAKALNVAFEKDTIFRIPRILKRKKHKKYAGQDIPWGITKVRALLSTSKGEGVKVCISDTGIDLTHPDLQDNIIADFNTIEPTKSGDDDHSHGSHVAGTIAAVDNTIGVIGIAPKAQLIAAKGLSKSGAGYASDLAETIDGCRDRGAHIINMSWGSSKANTVIHEALKRAEKAGLILVAAAGNSSGPVGYPAAHPEVVAVSALDSEDKFAYFSCFGEKVENSAPGVDVQSTAMDGGYTEMSGTSMASPHVVGVAALMLSLYPSRTRNELFGIDIGLGTDKQGKRGRIDAVKSTE